MRRTVLVVCALGLVLGGCARGGEPTGPVRTLEPRQTASSPSPKATAADSDACSLLTAKDRQSIAGEKIEVVTPVRPMDRVLQCRWVKKLGTPQPTAVMVLSQPVQAWLPSVPAEIDRLIQSGRGAKYSKRLQEAKKTIGAGADEVSDREGCDLFSLVVEARFGQKNLTRYVVFQDTTTAAAVTCTQGVYTVVSYSEPGLQASVALRESLERLVGRAHQRAVKMQ